MRTRIVLIGIVVAVGLTACTPQASSGEDPTSSPKTTATASALPSQPSSIVIGADELIATDASGSTHRYAYDTWPDDIVGLMTDMFGTAPRTSTVAASGANPAHTTYLWPALLLEHMDSGASASGSKQLTVQGFAGSVTAVKISAPGGVRVGDPAASAAAYPVFCNSAGTCFRDMPTSSGASTTLRVLDSAGTRPTSEVVLGYVDATTGVTDIIAVDRTWGTDGAIDVRD